MVGEVDVAVYQEIMKFHQGACLCTGEKPAAIRLRTDPMSPMSWSALKAFRTGLKPFKTMEN